MNCPGCQRPMTAHDLSARLGASLSIDLCASCQSLWFDGHESLQLSPSATLRLFEIIGDTAAISARHEPAPFAACPRCGLRLHPVEDMQRSTRFRYGRCPRRHGRFITFFDFLREKNVIRPISASQRAELRAQLQTVNCANCGAPIDLAGDDACSHCGSPLSMLDIRQAAALIDQLKSANRELPQIDPALPVDLLRARREVEQAFARSSTGIAWLTDLTSTGSVAASVMALAKWLGQKL